MPGDDELHECEKDHASEAQSMEDLGRLLGEVKSYARCGFCLGLFMHYEAKPLRRVS